MPFAVCAAAGAPAARRPTRARVQGCRSLWFTPKSYARTGPLFREEPGSGARRHPVDPPGEAQLLADGPGPAVARAPRPDVVPAADGHLREGGVEPAQPEEELDRRGAVAAGDQALLVRVECSLERADPVGLEDRAVIGDAGKRHHRAEHRRDQPRAEPLAGREVVQVAVVVRARADHDVGAGLDLPHHVGDGIRADREVALDDDRDVALRIAGEPRGFAQQAVEARTEPAVLGMAQELDRQEPAVLLGDLGGAVAGPVVEHDDQVVAADLAHDLTDLVEQEAERSLLLVGGDQKVDHDGQSTAPAMCAATRLERPPRGRRPNGKPPIWMARRPQGLTAVRPICYKSSTMLEI